LDEILQDPASVTDDPAELLQNLASATKHLEGVVGTLVHEPNHLLNPPPPGQEPGFFEELAGYSAGYNAERKRPIDKKLAFLIGKYIINGYPHIKQAFEAEGPNGSPNNIVTFMADLTGQDPKTATRESLLNPNNIPTGAIDLKA